MSDILKSEFGLPTRRYAQSQSIHGFFYKTYPHHLKKIKVSMWTPYYWYICYLQFAEGLQKQLTALCSYASLGHIIVSIHKTKVLILIEHYTTVCGSFHYGDNIIVQGI